MFLQKTKNFPPKPYSAITLYPFIFYKGELDSVTLTHEMIHLQQQEEMYILGFYLLYIFYWFRFGYKKNPFEVEAYFNQHNSQYLSVRPKHSWRKYINLTT